MGNAKEQVGRNREGLVGLLIATITVIVGVLLIYFANETLSTNAPGQALVAYVGVFVVAAGILYAATTLLDRRELS